MHATVIDAGHHQTGRAIEYFIFAGRWRSVAHLLVFLRRYLTTDSPSNFLFVAVLLLVQLMVVMVLVLLLPVVVRSFCPPPCWLPLQFLPVRQLSWGTTNATAQ